MSSTTDSTQAREATATPASDRNQLSRLSELAWLPFQTTLSLLGQAQASAEAMIRLQQDFAEDLQSVFRRQQVLFRSLSERYLKLLGGMDAAQSEADAPVAALDRLQGTTLATMSEIGAAVLAAQANSLKAIKQQMHLDTPESTNGHGSGETAH